MISTLRACSWSLSATTAWYFYFFIFFFYVSVKLFSKPTWRLDPRPHWRSTDSRVHWLARETQRPSIPELFGCDLRVQRQANLIHTALRREGTHGGPPKERAPVRDSSGWHTRGTWLKTLFFIFILFRSKIGSDHRDPAPYQTKKVGESCSVCREGIQERGCPNCTFFLKRELFFNLVSTFFLKKKKNRTRTSTSTSWHNWYCFPASARVAIPPTLKYQLVGGGGIYIC